MSLNRLNEIVLGKRRHRCEYGAAARTVPEETNTVKTSGPSQLVRAALYTEICLAMPALQALAEWYDVFIVTDAPGGVTAEAHDMAVRRMAAAGAVPSRGWPCWANGSATGAREKTAVGAAFRRLVPMRHVRRLWLWRGPFRPAPGPTGCPRPGAATL